jgi:endo-1,3(4)-beta-glucanase
LFLSTDPEEGMLHPLVYDEVYKGIVSSEGFHRKDAGADFGNTVYNDHHYHYGYWIVSASIFLYLNPYYPQRALLEGRIETLVRDVANPNPEDPFFPRFRHFDWYLGHSYSHGVTPMGDGKDQESASEEMNFHYGLALWGKVTTTSKLEALGELMLKVNARAIQTYFFMTKPESPEKDNGANHNYSAPPIEAIIHPSEFLPNKVTGILFDNKVDCTTWFSPDRCCIHGIQMIPVSPITPFFRPLTFVKEEWEEILGELPMIKEPRKHPNPWQSILFTNYARIHQREALRHLEYVPMDDGLSRAWALYMGATTP